jgi:PHD/YefM family antitoxin component YafN of YafNO toxin-antitoxin module
VEAVLINKEEYDRLKEQLEIKDFIVEEPEVVNEPIQEPAGVIDEVKSEKVVSIHDLYEEIRQLKEELRSLKK